MYYSGIMTDLRNSRVDNCSVVADLSLSCVYYCGISLVCDFCGVEVGVKRLLCENKNNIFIPQNDHRPSHNSNIHWNPKKHAHTKKTNVMRKQTRYNSLTRYNEKTNLLTRYNEITNSL